MNRTKEIIHELKHHLPFTVSATIIAIIIVVGIKLIFNGVFEENSFEIFHPLHIIASSLVSAGIFYKYNPKIILAIFVGVISSILIGTLSDVIFPFIGAWVLNLKPGFHLPVFESPLKIIGVSILGAGIGILTKTTKIPHFIHVGLSIFASLFYLLAFTQEFSLLLLISSIFVVTLSVLIPCCVSDIIFPFFLLGKKIKDCPCP
ncbi:hypothetical protein COU58_00500 [Candidatus Pacearchaeota archaeon CG10_big_fil_rev_8_21_14_0_10_32_42]|nr:MAG: hypothetical protein COU58_00500 [Candidatus Pacearchaeota archaeon CG10_big_fil_rev_8_21_14_0_10_32_42]